jgi:hypothetical protein
MVDYAWLTLADIRDNGGGVLGVGSRLWFGYGINGMLVGLVILFLLTLCIMAVTSGVVYITGMI